MSSGGNKQLNKNQLFKRDKIRNARFIRAQTLKYDNAKTPDLSKENAATLNVHNFIDSRSYDIEQLFISMKNSKSSNSTRVFQSLPRKLRRRTASHNIKRIPKRMRNRAKREMNKNNLQSDINTVTTKKNGKKLNSKELYKAKMSLKLLRLFTKSKQLKLSISDSLTVSTSHKSIRQKIAFLHKLIKDYTKDKSLTDINNLLNNINGSFDNTGINQLSKISHNRIKYLKRQNNFNWLSSHIWNAKRSHMIKRWGFQIPYAPTQKCYRLTHRLGGNTAASDGALCMDSSYIGTMILSHTDNTKVNEVIKIISNSKAIQSKYKNKLYWFEGLCYNFNGDVLGPLDLLWISENTVMIRLHPSFFETIFNSILDYDNEFNLQDCRFSLSSILIRGAKTLTALSSIIRTPNPSESFNQFINISSISDYSSLPKRSIFAFNSIDPRYLSTPSPIKPKKKTTSDDILKLQNNLPADEITNILNKLSDPKERNLSYRNQNSLKQLAQRRRQLLLKKPGETKNQISFNEGKDPKIPLLLVKRPKSNDWLLILPWHWLLPFWYQLNRISRVYHIGLRQLQQLNYENQQLYFPDDFPFTKAGHLENSIFKRDSNSKKWERKPIGKRLNYTKVKNIHAMDLPSVKGEIGDYFSCDWEFLRILRNGINYLLQKEGKLTMVSSSRTSSFDEKTSLRNLNVLNDIIELYKDSQAKKENNELVPVILSSKPEKYPLDLNKAPIQLSIIETPLKVTPISCTFLEKGHPADYARIYHIPKEHYKHWLQVANGIYRSDGKRDHEIEHPKPDINHLIGFVTSGTYHQGQGRGVANGFVDSSSLETSKQNYVLIRNVGTNVYRIAKASLIDI
ncbi:hypothetical protein Kpol_1054p44 [Vanderwaltozyma polyspora DSM 70294]|uniref:Pop1 N-terminal domain-containing protein n=1 Tax=Vanderwaltozyma polyspora (strain ATCC 22028 / DSM 70294 / BCRC 21397 / CBS 2163 / NBRC 10782 / NRRL Y-8283 / UCD 57-17) TaxID=436907 RepID=A7TID1_VANPO|nr:uncharacterized protein Kpol_1054p44 [Vanderwaltozyma polyspora DSM 70294]EDO17997.1 hypothetical protein Kpol_1054p44 [Vanderwaltozyma polyspora DSM 70294]